MFHDTSHSRAPRTMSMTPFDGDATILRLLAFLQNARKRRVMTFIEDAATRCQCTHAISKCARRHGRYYRQHIGHDGVIAAGLLYWRRGDSRSFLLQHDAQVSFSQKTACQCRYLDDGDIFPSTDA